MSEPEYPTVYSAGWLDEGTVPVLPAMTQRAMAREDIAAARETAEAAAVAEDKAEGAVLVARQRGIDTSLRGVFDRALRASKADDYRAVRSELAQSIAAGEVDVLDGSAAPVSRSMDTGYEIDALVRQHTEDHRWLVAYEVRAASRRGSAAEHLEAKRQEAEVRWSQLHAPGERVYRPPNRGEVVRSTPEGAVLGVY